MSTSSGVPGGMLCLEDGHSPDKKSDKPTLAIMTPSSASSSNAQTSIAMQNGESSASSNNTDELTFLIEVVKATIPKRRGKQGAAYDVTSRGMHCTAHWVGPTNPSGRKRREKMLHRTKTMKIDAFSTNTNSSMNDFEEEDGGAEAAEADCTEHIFTVNDSSLFLFSTTMKQLVNASVQSSLFSEDTTTSGNEELDNNENDSAFNNGGIRFDIFEKPLDMLNSVYSTVLSDNITEKEANAVTRDSVKSFNSYRLVGSVFLTPRQLLSKCNEERFECDLMENWKKIQQQQQKGGDSRAGRRNTFLGMTTKAVEGGRLALRMRLASEFDANVMKSLTESSKTNSTCGGLQASLLQNSTSASANNIKRKKLKPAQLITEVDENLLAAETSIKAISNISPMAQESVRYLFSNDTEKRMLVKPYPDPARPEETTWFTEEGLHHECYQPSTNWIQAGQEGERSLGKVYLEVLECRGLPNTDAGGSIGNKTDAFISMVYGDVMVQTEVIDDSCSPMWMPWSSRAFVFQMAHPSTVIYIGVADYDVGPLEHECIGRATIQMSRFHPGTMYTLTYTLYESANLADRGEEQGTITIRLRTEVPDEKRYLMEGWKAPERKWINSQQWKSHRVAKYCSDGPHDEEVFEMRLFRSHINELLTQKRYMSYAIKDAVRSLVFWRGQVKVGNVWLPLHSAILFYFSIHVVENPHLLPAFMLFGSGWILVANMLDRSSHPNPWHRGHSFAHYWNALTHGAAYQPKAKEIRPMQGHKEAAKKEAVWKQRIADDDDNYAKQLELDAKIKTISDDAVIRTKAKANGALVDPISAVAGAKLLPYQQRLSGYCSKVRYIRNVLNWNESIISFFFTLMFFGAGFVALFIPWRFLLLWTSRLSVWLFLGPWMRLLDMFFHEETERQKSKVSSKAIKVFHEQHKVAKILRENALKMKAFRVKLFGIYITRLPEFNLTRHEDIPLPESFAEPYHSEEEISAVKFVPSQDLTGAMIPMTGQDAVQRKTRKEKEKDGLIGQYQKMSKKRSEPAAASVPEEEVEEGFELMCTENQVVCLQSESSIEPTSGADDTNSTEITHARRPSEPVSDRAIQLALEKEVQEHNMMKKSPKKQSWIFSASISLSLRQQTVDDASTPAICNSPTEAICDGSDNMIESMDYIVEEGVEIVPFVGSANDDMAGSNTTLQLENGSDHVSVFYVKDNAENTEPVIDDANEATIVEEKGDSCDLQQSTYGDSKADLVKDWKTTFKDERLNDKDATADAVKKIRFRLVPKAIERD